MGRGAWRDYNPPDDGEWSVLGPGDDGYDPAVAVLDPIARPVRDFDDLPSCGLFFGPLLGWDTRREGGKMELPVADPDGDVEIRRVCRVCASGYADVRLGPRTICAGCLQTGDLELNIRAATLAEFARADVLPTRDARMREAQSEIAYQEARDLWRRRNRDLVRMLDRASRKLVILPA